MNYRTLGRTGLNVSEVSLGTEYLIGAPRERIIAVIREAIAQRINYFDLFCAEPAFRDAMGEAFAGQRENVLYAAHLGAAVKDGQYQKTRSVRKAEQFFDDFLTRYDTGYVDVLFMHNCDSQKDFDSLFSLNGLLGLALRLKEQGKARFLAFSGHTASTARQAVESGYIDILMYPVSIAGNAAPGRKELFAACLAQDVGVVAMKPYGGGKLLHEKGTFRVSKFLSGGAAYQVNKTAPITPVKCLSYTLSQAGISTVVPGCSNLDHLADALAYCTATEEEKDFAEIVVDFQQYVEGECVYCNHCLPCPAAIDIGQTIRLFEMAQQDTDVRAAYEAMPTHASDCTQCGACEKRCPFGVRVMDKMAQAAACFA
ncbi:MAG: aldo/keto reductase [Anaerolineae bacterium]|nr:aldo/keto reductase [Anaerolineae bacterium]